MADIRIIPSAGAINVTGSADFRGTGGSSILFLTGSGQIGVGTTTPESEFHIVSSGTRFITLDRSGTRSYDLGVNSAGTMLVTDNTVSADRISLSHSGSVGIGTTAPLSLLHLRGSEPAIRIIDTDDSSTSIIGSTGGYTYIRPFSRDFRVINDAGVGLLTVKTGGSIGIGTTNPVQALHVVGSIYQRTGDVITWNNGDAQIGAVSGYNLAFSTYDGVSAMVEHLRITSGGNVGIGTTSAASKLTVYKAAGNSMFQLINASEAGFSMKIHNSGSSNTGDKTFMQYLDYNGNVNGYISFNRGSSAANGFISFGDNGGERVRFDNGGNVGIGTTGPTKALHVVGEVRFSSYGAGTVTGTAARSLAVDSSGNVIEVANSSLAGSGTANRVAYWTDSNTLAADADFFFDGTNVGIGLTTPGAPLHVFKTATYSAIISRADWNSGTETRLGIGKQYGVLGYISTDLVETVNDTSYIALNYKSGLSSYAEGLRVYNNGNVGIGTTNPTAKLFIEGNDIVLNTEGSAQGKSLYFRYSDGATVQSDSYLKFNTGGSPTEKVRILADGNVGIGNTNPNQKLVVAGNIAVSSSNTEGAIWLGEGQDIGLFRNNTYDLVLSQQASSGNPLYLAGAGDVIVSIDSNNNSTGNKFIVGSNAVKASNELFSVNESGNVYVGNDLNVDGKITAREFHTSFVSASIIYQSGSTQFGNSSDDTHVFTGNVGIGITAPTEKLELSGTSNVYARITTTDASNAGVRFNAVGAREYGILSDGALRFYDFTAAAERMRITSGGDIGIGTASPSNTLQVVGGVTATSFTGSLQGNITGNAATATTASFASTAPYSGLTGTVPTWNQDTSGTATNASYMVRRDLRAIAPNDEDSGKMRFGFTSYGNDNSAPYGDYLHLRSYTDGSGGNDNLVMFLKSGIGMRIYQQTWNSGTDYSTYKDVAFTDSNITGNAATATTASFASTAPYSGLTGTVPTWNQSTTGNAATATTATNVAWSGVSAGYRENYDLGFRPADNTSSYAGFRFGSPGNDGNAGYFLIRGGADNDVYTQNGITLVADLGWLTLAQRTQSDKGIRFMTGTTSTTKMTITNGGNVGIGTTSPGSRLTVIDSNNTTPLSIGAGSNAIFEFKGNSTSGYTTTFNINDTALYIGHNSSGRNLVLQTNSTDRLTIGGSGAATFSSSVTAVSALLQSANTNSVVDIFTLYNPSQTSSGVRQKFANGYGDLAAIKVSQIDNGAGADNGQIEFQTATDAALSTKLTILDTGAATFASSVTAGSFVKSAGTSAQFLKADGSVDSSTYLTAFSETDTLQSVTTRGSSTTTGMTIAGDVGIGTTAPSRRLTVSQGTGTNTNSYMSFNNSAERWVIGNEGGFGGGTSNDFIFYDTDYRVTIKVGGNVGIGTTTPAGKLDVRAGSGGRILFGSYDANYYAAFEGGDQLNFYNGASNATAYINYNGPSAVLLGRNLHVEGNSSGGTTGAVRINSVGNVGIGLTNPGAKLQVAGTVATDSALADVDAYRIIKPNGGVRVTANSSETGAIKITYPVSYTNTMHRVKLNIYEYTTNESFTIYFGGYNYSPSSEWYNEFAYILNNPGVDRNFTVRFGHDGSRMVVYIGELASGWTYPQIFIQEVELGYSGQSSTWRDGAWAIGFEASAFQNVTRTISNPQATNWARNGSSVYFENGSVGIGTTSPIGKLQIGGTSGNLLTVGTLTNDWGGNIAMGITNGNGVILSKINAANDTNRVLVFLRDDTNGASILGYTPTGGGANIGFQIRANASSYFNGGNVGIGTDSPTAKLHVSGGDAVLRNAFIGEVPTYGAENAQFSHISRAAAGEYSFLSANDGETFINSKTGTNIRFRVNNSDKVIITSAGNVGINTTSPSTNLHVQGSNLMATLRNSSTSADQYTQLEFIAGSRSAYIWLGNQATTSWAGDGGLNIYTGTGHMDFWTAGTQKMRLQAGGNLGIGTLNPGYKLQVDGTVAGFLAIGAGDNVRTGLAHYDTTAQAAGVGGQLVLGYKYTDAGDFTEGAIIKMYKENSASGQFGSGLKFQVRNHGDNLSTKVTIDPSGNVGIGSVSPGAKLHVKQTGIADNTATTLLLLDGQFQDTSIEGADIVSIGFRVENSTGGSQSSQAISFAYDNTLSLMKDGGTVGVGTTSATNRLTVYQGGGVRVTGITSGDWIEMSGNLPGYSDNQYPVIKSNGTIHFANNNKYSAFLEGSNTYFGILDSNTTTRVFLATSGNTYFTGGNVGIGTTSPSFPLHVVGYARANGFSVNDGSGAVSAFIGYEKNWIGSGTSATLAIAAESQKINFYAGGTTDVRMMVSSSGNVGIGTSVSNQKLHVYGSNPRALIQDSSTGYPILQLDNDSNGSFYVAVDNSAGTGFGSAYGRYLYSEGTYPMILVTDSAERIRITAGGNVGVGGQTAPNGYLAFPDDTQTRKIVLWDGSANNNFQFYGVGIESSTFLHSIYDVTDRYMWVAGVNTGARSEIMVLQGNGNLGIGNTAPNQRLELSVGNGVTGGLRINYAASATGEGMDITYLNNGATTTSFDSRYNSDSAVMQFRMKTAATAVNAMTILGNGNVGIGTTSPTAKVNVLIGAGGANGTVGLKIGGTGNYDSLELGIEGDYNGQIRTYGNDLHLYSGHWRTVGNTATEDHAIRFFTSKTSSANWSTAKMILTADGNVGIGSNSPSRKLDVVGNARIGDNTSQQAHAALQVSAGQGSVTTYRDIDMCGSWAAGEGHAITANYSTNANNIVGQIVFEHNSPGSRIKFGRLYDSGDQSTYPFHMVSNGSAGRLGIGTSVPTAPLDTLGVRVGRDFSIANRATVRLDSNTADYPADILFGHTAAANQSSWDGVYWSLSSRANDASNKFYIYRAGGNPGGSGEEVILTLQPNGNVGVGSTAPAFKLDVAGTIRATGDVIAYSDARVKENIVTLENSLDLVQKLRGVRYNRIGESENKVGVIAQEVLEILPEVVQQDQEGNYSVAYGNITAVLIEAIKQQQLQIDELKLEIKQLKG